MESDQLSAIRTLESGSDEGIKNLANKLRHDAQLRDQLAQSDTVWTLAGRNLDDLHLKLLKNLSATRHAGETALRVGTVSQIIELIEQGSKLSKVKTRLLWELLANLCGSCSILPSVKSSFLHIITRSLYKSEYVLPILIFLLHSCSRDEGAVIKDLCDAGTLDAITVQSQKWLDDETLNSVIIEIIMNCIKYQFGTRVGNDIVETHHSEWVNTLCQMYTIGVRQLLKSGQDCSKGIRSLTIWNVERLSDAMAKVVTYTDHDSRIQGVADWETLISLLRLSSELVPLYQSDFSVLLEKSIDLLKFSKSLPVRNKLGSHSTGESEIDLTEFPFIREELIPLITYMIQEIGSQGVNYDAQEYVRESGGLAALLESCIIDENNPFMKERAIVCLRVLLQNNAENQKFVAQLEARQVADPEVLAAAGYEANIQDGKISIRSMSNNVN